MPEAPLIVARRYTTHLLLSHLRAHACVMHERGCWQSSETTLVYPAPQAQSSETTLFHPVPQSSENTYINGMEVGRAIEAHIISAQINECNSN